MCILAFVRGVMLRGVSKDAARTCTGLSETGIVEIPYWTMGVVPVRPMETWGAGGSTPNGVEFGACCIARPGCVAGCWPKAEVPKPRLDWPLKMLGVVAACEGKLKLNALGVEDRPPKPPNDVVADCVRPAGFVPLKEKGLLLCCCCAGAPGRKRFEAKPPAPLCPNEGADVPNPGVTLLLENPKPDDCGVLPKSPPCPKAGADGCPNAGGAKAPPRPVTADPNEGVLPKADWDGRPNTLFDPREEPVAAPKMPEPKAGALWGAPNAEADGCGAPNAGCWPNAGELCPKRDGADCCPKGPEVAACAKVGWLPPPPNASVDVPKMLWLAAEDWPNGLADAPKGLVAAAPNGDAPVAAGCPNMPPAPSCWPGAGPPLSPAW